MTLYSTINYSVYYHSEEDDAESDPDSDPKVATHTSYGKKNESDDNSIMPPLLSKEEIDAMDSVDELAGEPMSTM